MVRKFKFNLKGSSPLLWHKFLGLDKEKTVKELPETEQAELRTYRCESGNLGVPAMWIRGSLLSAAYDFKWGKGSKQASKDYIASRIRIEPFMLDLGMRNYEIDKQSVPSGGKYRGVRDFCVRPKINKWEVEGTLITSLEETEEEIKRLFELAGMDEGIGSNRPNGYGRYTVEVFNRA